VSIDQVAALVDEATFFVDQIVLGVEVNLGIAYDL